MKTIPCALAVALLSFASVSRAAENRYDLLSKMLTPFVSLLAADSKNPNHAFTLTALVEVLTDLPPDLLGTRVELAMETPDKLRFTAPVQGENLTLCRRGQELWAWPGAKVDALLARATKGKTLPPPDPKFRLAPFQLPLPEKELALLPALFQVKDVGSEKLDGETCRVIDIFLLPELTRSLKARGWAARAWVRGDYTPARLSIAKPGWQISLRCDRVQFAPALPASTWQPSATQTGDVRPLTPAEYEQLLSVLIQ